MHYQILFNNNKPIPPRKISDHIHRFGESYKKTVRTIIKETCNSHLDKNIFVKNSAILLNNFGMARSGPFKGIKIGSKGEVQGPVNKLYQCWDKAKENLVPLKVWLKKKDLSPRSRILVLLDENSREKVIDDVWTAFKKMLPITMGKNSLGLVGASKILFSVFPEIVLPVDNAEWLSVFRTVDMGDVINTMANEIIKWEKITGSKLQYCDRSEYTTLPAIYNVMAMRARP